MKPLLAPRPVTTELRPMNRALIDLELKRVHVGLSAEEQQALAQIHEEMEQRNEPPLSEQDVNAMAEADAEARRHGAFPVNPHGD